MSNRLYFFDKDQSKKFASEPAFAPGKILDIKRADTRAATSAITSVATAIGAERSITEQDQGRKPPAVGVNAQAEEQIAGVLVKVLITCPSVTAASGVTPDELRGDLEASRDARIFATQGGQLARGANETALVLGFAVQAAVSRTTTGLGEIAAAGGPDVAAAARADAEIINEPLKTEADKRAARADETRRVAAAASAALKEADEVARFHAITARISDGAPVSKRDVLWARDFAKGRPELTAQSALAPADKGDKGNRRQKGR